MSEYPRASSVSRLFGPRRQVRRGSPRRRQGRALQTALERLDERRMLAFDLVAAYADSNEPFYVKGGVPATLTVAPQQITLKFSPEVRIDPATIAGNISVVQAGSPLDIGLSIDDVPSENQVAIRFKETLRDGNYQIVVGAGLRTRGTVIDSVVPTTLDVRVDLGAFVVSVVPQPLTRDSGTGALSQARDRIDVYFNAEDPLLTSAAQNAAFYRLVKVDPNTDVEVSSLTPTTVSYDATTGRATLDFGGALQSDAGLFRLEIGAGAASVPVSVAEGDDSNSSFTTARVIGALSTAGVSITGLIAARPRLPTPVGDLDFPRAPGALDTPGQRDVPVDSGSHGLPPFAVVDPVTNALAVAYNFRPIIGTDPQGNLLQNVITEAQKQRAREIFELFSLRSGVRFVETPDQGLMVATGDLRAFSPNIPADSVAGLGGGSGALMNALINWGDSEYGGAWFRVAMHEIGHALGLAHSYDLPSIMGADLGGEAVFPGDYDFEHLRQLYPTSGSDIDVFRFSLAEAGRLAAETVVARPGMPVTSRLDTVVSLYREETVNGRTVQTLVARNDDYYGRDSFVSLDLEAGTYFVAVSSTGNTAFNPSISNSGADGRTDGDYRLDLRFTPASAASNTIIDQTGTPLDGDRDGRSGGTFRFWFNAAAQVNTIYVDKAAYTSLAAAISAGADGTIARPYYLIGDAIAAATAGSIIRILGDASSPYQIGTDLLGNPLEDGTSFNVPSGVTVMIDGGAVFKLRAALIDVGSSSQLVSRANAAIQVLGVPATGVFAGSQVTFTSWHDDTIGGDTDALGPGAKGGQWGGIVLRQDSDVASKRAFVNSITGAILRYGGGKVAVDLEPELASFAPIQVESTRPTILFNQIEQSAGAAIAATPNSFEDTGDRVGPELRGNRLSSNSINGLFVQIDTQFGTPLDRLDVPARFKSTDIVYVVQENLVINGGVGGYTSTVSRLGNLVAGNLQVTGLAKTSDLRVGMQVEIRDPANPGESALPVGQATIVSVDSPSAITLSVAPVVTANFATITVRAQPARIEQTGDVTINSSFVTNLDPAAMAGITPGMRVEIVDPANPSLGLLPGGFATVLGVLGNTVLLSGTANATRTGMRVSFIDETAPLGFARDSGRLTIDPGVVVKLQGSRIELERGIAQLVAEGRPGKPVIFTSLGDNRYGAGGTFDTNGNVPDKFDAIGRAVGTLTVGDWGGIILNGGSRASIDRAYLAFGGGETPIEGGFDSFNLIEVHQGDLRLTNTRIENNAAGTARTQRTGRGDNAASTVFIRGAQPIIVGNDFRANLGAVINVNANALSDLQRGDVGRSTGGIDRFVRYDDNFGPLVRGNVLQYGTGGQAVAGMVVRGGEITVESVWDDTDIVHVLQDEIIVQNFHTATGVRLLSKSDASLVVKLFGANAGFTAAGENLDIDDRIGGTVQVVGQPGYPVILTSLRDDTTGASVDPLGRLVTDTNVDGSATAAGGGDWRSLRFLPFSNDRNVTILIEQEKSYTGAVDANATIAAAEWLGILSPNYATGNNTWESAQEKSGDENRRLGFEVHGNVAYDDATDVDVYTFVGYAGSEVWIDIDKTNSALDTIVELLDAGGVVRARSVDGVAEGGVEQGEVVQDLTGGTSVTYQFAPGTVPGPGGLPGLLPGQFSLLPGTLTGVIYDTAPGIPTAIQTFSVDANGVFTFQSILGRNRMGVPNTVPLLAFGSDSYATGGSVNLANGTLTLTYSGTGMISSQVEVRYSYSTPALSTVTGIGQTLGKDSWRGGDFFTQNPRDAGMRVILPGSQGVQTRYYLRVRSQPRYEPTTTGVDNGGVTATTDAQYRSDVSSAVVKNGATSGRYELRVRLRQRDEKPGSTVRYADIRHPAIGIDVQGLPKNSPLVADTAENPTDTNDTFANAQYIGNVLESNRGAISVAGTTSAEGDIDWYTFALNYEQIQSIAGVNDSGFSWATVFDIDYADGFRGDLTISVFDEDGTLLYVGRDSDVADDQPGPQQGNDFDDLSKGSSGKLDAFIGTVNLVAGGPTGGGGGDTGQPPTPPNPAAQLRYYVAVSSNERLPTELNATFSSAAANTVVRLEPIASVDRIITDRIGAPSARYPGVASAERMIDTLNLQTHITPFTLADVTLFVSTGSSLVTVDAMRDAAVLGGGVETTIVANYGGGTPIGDLLMRSDGNLYFYRGVNGNATTAGQLALVDSGTGTATVVGNDDIKNPIVSTQINLAPVEAGTVATTTFNLTGDFLRPPQDAAITGAVRFQRVDTSVTPNVTRVGNWTFTANAPAAINGVATLTFTPGAVDPLLGNAPVAGTVNLRTGVVSVTWATNVPVADVRLTTVTYQYTFQDIATDSVDAVAWQRVDIGDYQNLVYSVWDPGSGQSFLYQANPTTGSAAYVNNQNWGLQGSLAAVGGRVRGLAWLGGTLYGVADNGAFFTVGGIDDGNFTVTTTAIATIAGAPAFAGLSVGPQNLQGGIYSNLLFGIDSTGGLYCLDILGNLQTVFDGDGDGTAEATTINTGVGGVTGLAFSPLDINLWHTTTRRNGDAGGGTSAADRLSMYFGLESLGGSQFGGSTAWQQDLLSNSAIGNNYNLPGGAYGSLTTNPFSLAGYNYTDKPTLYFDYWLETEGASGTPANVAMRDSARVLASIDGGLTWELLATNNSLLSTADTSDRELPSFQSVSSKISNDAIIENQHVQELFDTTNWRQARVDLGKFAGQSNIRLRFDFSSAGKMDETQQTADIDGNGINDVINDIVNDTIGRYGRPTLGLANTTGAFRDSDTPNLTTARQRGQNNAFEGFYIDDIVIGFAERGESVTGATTGVTTFFNVGTPGPSATVAAQVLNGPYQLEIRRGTERSAVAVLDPLAAIAYPETFDTNSRLTGQFSNTTAYGPLLGDANQVREQGQFVIESNIISGAAQYGIRIDAAARDGGSNAPNPGSPRNLPTLNNARLASGVVVSNNVVARSGTAGILFSGDANTGNVPAAAVPFGRIVNNTIYGGDTASGVGVQVTDNASPTLLNNLFANLALGVSVDGSSASRTPVVGTSAYWNTATPVAGIAENGAVTLPSDPFVNRTLNNFYLVAGTRAIDSSLNALQDRNEFVQVNSPLGITASPIIAPDRDLYGQLRGDDPGVTNMTGLGSNVFKDRGAIDRVDFTQPSASIVNPLDGGPSDFDVTANAVTLRGADSAGVTRFELQLSDVGIGIDDSTVTSAAFTVTRDGVTLVAGVDYVFRYLQTSKRVVFESAAVYMPGTYEIRVNRTSIGGSDVNMIADLAGNRMLPNKPNGTTTFTIRMVGLPSAPMNLTGTPGAGQVALQWMAPASNGGGSITDYVVQYSIDGVTWTTFLDGTTTATSTTVTGLTNGTPYYFRVAAVNEGGTGPFVQAGPITPREPAPAPLNLVATPGSGQVALSWVAPTPPNVGEVITDYRLEYSSNGGVNWILVADGVSTTTVATVTGLTNGVAYSFRVTTITNLGEGLSAVANAMPIGLPLSPTGLVAVAGDRAVTVTWNAVTTGPATGGLPLIRHEVQWSSNNGVTWSPWRDAGPDFTETITGLVNNTPYLVSVRALNSQGASPAATTSTPVTPRPQAAAPTRLTARGGNGTVGLAWTAPLNTGGVPIVNYVVQYSTNFAGNVATATWTAVTTGTNQARASVAVPNGLSYVFRVAALTRNGQGVFSAVSPRVTPYSPLAFPAAPTSLTVTSPISRRATLAWTAPPANAGGAVVGYVIQYRLATSTSWTSVRVTTTGATIQNLFSGRDYVFRVQASNLAGSGVFSESYMLRIM